MSAAVVAWFGDPANWTGSDGIPNRLTEHLVLCFVVDGRRRSLVALPVGLYIGHTGRFAFLAVSRSRTSGGPSRRTR